ncbi:MAG: formylmethanofuran dehydrogenase subunit C, partial [Candidatus Altarchaeaceae archaeon]
MDVILNTANTIDQGGIAKGGKKISKKYKEVAAICFMNPDDLKILGNPEKVKVITEEGEVVLFAKSDEG